MKEERPVKPLVRIGGVDVVVIKGDIAKTKVDAIVNAANRRMWMGSGVAGALKKAGGSEIEQEALMKGPASIGDVVVTGAGRLEAKYVLHAVAIDYSFRASADTVTQALRNCLETADELEIASLAIPVLGAGVGGLSVIEAARAMSKVLKSVLDSGLKNIKTIVIVLLDTAAFREFKKVAQEILLAR